MLKDLEAVITGILDKYLNHYSLTEQVRDKTTKAILTHLKTNLRDCVEVDEQKVLRIINKWDEKIFYNTLQNRKKLAYDLSHKNIF